MLHVNKIIIVTLIKVFQLEVIMNEKTLSDFFLVFVTNEWRKYYFFYVDFSEFVN